MKLSIIWKLSGKENENQVTLDNLREQFTDCEDTIQLLIYPEHKEQRYQAQFQEKNITVVTSQLVGATELEVFEDAQKQINGAFVTYLYGGDYWSDKALIQLLQILKEYSDYPIVMMHKIIPENMEGAFAKVIPDKKTLSVNVKKDYDIYPFYFGGTVLNAEIFKNHPFHKELGIEAEREFFLSIVYKYKKIYFLNQITFFAVRAMEGDFTFFEPIYDEDWYERSFTQFWIPYLKKLREKHKTVPVFIQYHFLFSVKARFMSNLNNRNKHVIPEGQEIQCLERIGQAFAYIDDDILFNCHKIPEVNVTDSLKWIYGILKHGKEYHFEKKYLAGNLYYGAGNVILNKIANLKTNILFMDFEDGILRIDGVIHPILYSMASEVYLSFNGKKYKLQYNERYALNKAFGVSLYKGHSFHVNVPMDGIKDTRLFCQAKIGEETIRIIFCYESHFSRMSGAFPSSYWCFGIEPLYMVVKDEEGMRIRAVTKKEKKQQERKLSKEMLLCGRKRAWLFLAIRKVYFMMRPIMKRKPIWMYLDKIYKGGDSSEYLYRYACAQKDNIQHYYLIDKHATDYKRIKKDGFKPMVRGSIKHRLVFLMADMMVISNSTVFAFNNYGLPNSKFIRDLVDFHVCCVQHGMSVQKIAVAQNRLRDNTRLYFCASKYEIENLSKPIYDYVGYDALKLTGVPRYDGLKNDDKKQIMISPTWRMQAAVPVRTSEGEQRDYNPMFKESTYFQVFNALINDPRLIEAAKKYGYRIKYVLHPIVSAQVDDFDKNDYVDIIPAVGDMSYETMFRESSLMVTDFSGIQFDFAYMRKPLVYLHHKDIPQHYEEGTFFYDTMAFGEIAHDNNELIDLLCEYMESGCKMKEEYVRRADDFFYYNDHNNCKRIYDTMIDYQEKKILPYCQK